jgi:hypothetical protein
MDLNFCFKEEKKLDIGKEKWSHPLSLSLSI